MSTLMIVFVMVVFLEREQAHSLRAHAERAYSGYFLGAPIAIGAGAEEVEGAGISAAAATRHSPSGHRQAVFSLVVEESKLFVTAFS